MNVNDITITSLDEILAFDIADGSYLFTLEEMQDATIANTQETVDITGRGGRKLNTLKKNKGVTVSGNHGLLSGGLMELQTGSKFKAETSTPIKWHDELVVSVSGSSGSEVYSATINYKAIGTTGNEIAAVYVKDANGAAIKTLKQDAAVAAGKFKYEPSSKKITMHKDDVSAGAEIAVYYTRNVAASVLANDSDAYSKKCALYINAQGEDACNNVYRVQFYVPKADFNGNFNLTIGGDQSVHAFEASSLAGSCGAGGNLWTYTIFGANTADAA